MASPSATAELSWETANARGEQAWSPAAARRPDQHLPIGVRAPGAVGAGFQGDQPYALAGPLGELFDGLGLVVTGWIDASGNGCSRRSPGRPIGPAAICPTLAIHDRRRASSSPRSTECRLDLARQQPDRLAFRRVVGEARAIRFQLHARQPDVAL